MADVVIYCTDNCGRCMQAKVLLDELAIRYTEVRLDLDRRHHREFLRATQGARTVPQVIIDGRWIGGLAELQALHARGELVALMQG